MRLHRRWVVPGIALASVLVALAVTSSWVTGKLARQVELTTLDWRVRSVPPRPAEESRVVLVLFDSASVAEWPYLVPFPRAAIAATLDAISPARPAVIGLDVFLDRRYPRLDAMDGGDARLRAAIRRAGNVVLATGTAEGPEGRTMMPLDPYFRDVAAGVASADLPTPYETIRDAALTVRAGGRLVPGFALAVWARASGIDVNSLLAAAERSGSVPVPGLPARYAALPAASAAQAFPVLFMGPPSRPAEESTGAFVAFRASDVAAMDPVAREFLFRDKVVLVGSGFHAEERFRSPFYEMRRAGGGIAGWTYGVEVHASAVENLLTGRFPRPVPAPLAWGAAFLGALGVTLATFGRGIAWGVGSAITLLLLLGAAAFVAFGFWTVHLPVVAPALAVVLGFLGSTSYISVVEGREKRAIRGAFAKYVAPAVVAELLDDPSRLKLGGEKRHVSILFSDVAGFTSLAESTDPQELIRILNEYLDAMTGIVLDERGMVDKYIGDAVMALYGAPVALPDHALRACRTALRMQACLAELSAGWRRNGGPELMVRIGVNSGTPVVGNIGGRERFDYTALGDAVNLAARLEPACKTYGVSAMISAETREAAGDAIVARELEVLAVLGKVEPVTVFELVALAGEELGPREEVLRHYARGLEAYRGRDFELAGVYFRAALEIDPRDGPSRLYLGRCERFVAQPPPEEWSFVERRQIK